MSTGDKRNDPFPFTIAEANAVIRLPSVDRMMRRKYTINSRDWDIPYLAGYSQDGSFVYIDRDLKDWPYLSRLINTNRFLTLHEHVEKALIDSIHENEGKELQRILILLRMTAPDDEIYFHCHGVATACEEYAVKLQYGPSGLKSYNAFMSTQVKCAESERIQRVPPDLDMTPYQGNDAEDRRLRAVMHQAMAA
jgi:hypothetical protein